MKSNRLETTFSMRVTAIDFLDSEHLHCEISKTDLRDVLTLDGDAAGEVCDLLRHMAEHDFHGFVFHGESDQLFVAVSGGLLGIVGSEREGGDDEGDH